MCFRLTIWFILLVQGLQKSQLKSSCFLLRELMFNSENCQFFFLSFLYLKWCMCRHEYDLMAAVVGSLYLSTSVVEILWCSVVNCPVHLSAQLVSGREVCCLQAARSISSSAGISKGDSFLLWEIKLKAWGFFLFLFFLSWGGCVCIFPLSRDHVW